MSLIQILTDEVGKNEPLTLTLDMFWVLKLVRE